MVRSKFSRPIMVMSFLYRYMNSNGLMISVSFHHSVRVSCVNGSGPTLPTGTIISFLSLSQKVKLKGFYRKMIYSLANLMVTHHHLPVFSRYVLCFSACFRCFIQVTTLQLPTQPCHHLCPCHLQPQNLRGVRIFRCELKQQTIEIS